MIADVAGTEEKMTEEEGKEEDVTVAAEPSS